MLTQRGLQMGSALAGAAWRPVRRVWMLALLLLLLVPCAHALEFQYNNPFTAGPLAGVARGLSISGALAPGDTARLVELIRRQPADAWYGLGRVELAISGGDHNEALLLAETLAAFYPHVVATTDCAGPCAIVWLSGAWRLLPKGKIGLQKPVVAAAPNSQAPSDAPPPYDPLAARLRNYFFKQGLPLLLYERSMVESTDPIYWLSEQEINATGIWPPYYYEKLHAQCPRLAATDESFHALRRCAARLVISQKALAFDKLLAGVNDRWWNETKDLYFNTSR